MQHTTHPASGARVEGPIPTATASPGRKREALHRRILHRRPQKKGFWRELAAVLIFGITASACSAADQEAAPGPFGLGGTTANPSESAGPTATDIRFEQESTLTLTPGETQTLRVTVSPPGVYRVRWALLGEALTASLDRSETTTDRDGTTELQLTAPADGTSSVFRVRATLASLLSAELPVSVSSSGFATLAAHPVYPGKRTATYWVASVHIGTSCAKLPGTPPPDGVLMAEGTFGSTPPQIPTVPAGSSLALVVRGDHKLGGCADVTKLMVNQLNRVDVPISDVPLRLEAANFTVSWNFKSMAPIQALLAPLQANTEGLVLGGAQDDVDALLDAMEALAPPGTGPASFDERRSGGNWHETLAMDTSLNWHLDANRRPNTIRASVAEWTKQGGATLNDQGTLAAQLKGSKVAGKANLFPLTWAGLDAVQVGLNSSAETPIPVSLKADPDDIVALGVQLKWYPSRLLAAAASRVAGAKAGAETTGIPAALADQVNCSKISEILVSAGLKSVGQSHEGCDLECTRALCLAGLGAIWKRVIDASPTPSTIEVSATGAAQVNEDATPKGFVGTWVGTLNGKATADASQSIGGGVQGSNESQVTPVVPTQ